MDKNELFRTLNNPADNITDFYSGMLSNPLNTLRQVFHGAVAGTRHKDVPLIAKVISPVEAAVGVASILHGVFMLNPFEIAIGAAEIGDSLGRYLQIGGALEKGPPATPA